MRGAWLWPAFFGLTLGEALLLNELPLSGDGPGGFVPGLLIAGFVNLFLVAAVAPVVARRLRRSRPDLPKGVAIDRAGTALVCAAAAAAVIAGLVHRPQVRAERNDAVAQALAVSQYIHAQEPQLRPGLQRADSIRLKEDLYRTCVPAEDPDRPLCLFVTTDQSPPGVTLDTERIANGAYRVGGSD